MWFGASGPDDSKGALPYDTYEIEELTCGANEGKELLGPIEVRVYRDAVTVDLGTLTNDDLPSIVVSKKSVTGEGELPGATLRVYDADGELVEEWVSGEEPHELTLLPGPTRSTRSSRPRATSSPPTWSSRSLRASR